MPGSRATTVCPRRQLQPLRHRRLPHPQRALQRCRRQRPRRRFPTKALAEAFALETEKRLAAGPLAASMTKLTLGEFVEDQPFDVLGRDLGDEVSQARSPKRK